MNPWQVLPKWILKSQLYVALCACLLEIFILKAENAYHSEIVWLIFLTFWGGYLFTIFRKKKAALLWSLLGFVLLSIFLLNVWTLAFYGKWLCIIVLGMIYNADRVREFALIKTFYVGGVWAATLVFLPLESIHWSLFFIVFLFVSGITFPFEIRDMHSDPFLTLPKAMGIQNTKILSLFFLISSSLLAFLYWEKDFSEAWILSSSASIILVFFSGPNRKQEYYSFFMESLSALPIFIYFILNLKSQIKL